MSYNNLDEDAKRAYARRLVFRRKLYEQVVVREGSCEPGLVLLVGDRPGPGAPQTASYHHTPFYSTKYCSGWLNAELLKEEIPEERLIWINSADWQGTETDSSILNRIRPSKIIALGGNAEKWLKKAGREFTKVNHPQYHKRFRNKERYELLDVLKEMTCT